ncbi:MAG: hypothetical protein ABWY56_13010, partial [Propionibacteriaceae bacterium]
MIVVLLTSCTTAEPSPPPTTGPVSQQAEAATRQADAAALQSISASIVGRDRTAFDHLVSRRDPGFAATAARIFDNLTELPLTSLSLRLSGRQHTVTSERRQVLTPDARVEQVRVSWRLE